MLLNWLFELSLLDEKYVLSQFQKWIREHANCEIMPDAVGLGVIDRHIYERVYKKWADFDFRTP